MHSVSYRTTYSGVTLR